MSLSVKFRCTTCSQQFQAATTPACVVCGASTWEPCIVESAPQGIPDVFMHPSGVAFCAYDELARIGGEIPGWAAPAIPAASEAARAATIKTRLAQGITTNSTFLAIASTSTAQDKAQIKALTRQVQALLRLQQGALGAVD